MQAILDKNYSEAYELFMEDLRDDNYYLTSALSRNVYRKHRDLGLIDDYILKEDGGVSDETISKMNSIKREEFTPVFEDLRVKLQELM